MALRNLIAALLFCTVTDVTAQPYLMAQALKQFKIGDYVEAIETLKKVRGDRKMMGTKYYLMGISYMRIQEYDEASKSFKSSIANGHATNDLWYEYTMNTSDDTTNSEYTKHVSGMRLKYTF